MLILSTLALATYWCKMIRVFLVSLLVWQEHKGSVEFCAVSNYMARLTLWVKCGWQHQNNKFRGLLCDCHHLACNCLLKTAQCKHNPNIPLPTSHIQLFNWLGVQQIKGTCLFFTSSRTVRGFGCCSSGGAALPRRLEQVSARGTNKVAALWLMELL